MAKTAWREVPKAVFGAVKEIVLKMNPRDATRNVAEKKGDRPFVVFNATSTTGPNYGPGAIVVKVTAHAHSDGRGTYFYDRVTVNMITGPDHDVTTFADVYDTLRRELGEPTIKSRFEKGFRTDYWDVINLRSS